MNLPRKLFYTRGAGVCNELRASRIGGSPALGSTMAVRRRFRGFSAIDARVSDCHFAVAPRPPPSRTEQSFSNEHEGSPRRAGKEARVIGPGGAADQQ